MTGQNKQLLEVLLEDMGFSMAALAKAIGYPHAALRAYRRGDLAATDSLASDRIRLKLGDIALMTTRLARHQGRRSGGPEQAALFETVLVPGYTAIGWDLYSYPLGARCAYASWSRGPEFIQDLPEPVGQDCSGLCHLALDQSAEWVLDRHIPDWRRWFHTDYQIVLAEDGHHSIRRKKP